MSDLDTARAITCMEIRDEANAAIVEAMEEARRSGHVAALEAMAAMIEGLKGALQSPHDEPPASPV